VSRWLAAHRKVHDARPWSVPRPRTCRRCWSFGGSRRPPICGSRLTRA